MTSTLVPMYQRQRGFYLPGNRKATALDPCGGSAVPLL
jgi:hypothetical protein